MTLENIVKLQKEYSLIGIPKDIHYRKEALERLLESIEDNEPAIYDALRLDLNKSKMEANGGFSGQIRDKLCDKSSRAVVKTQKSKDSYQSVPGKKLCIQGTIRCEPYYRTLELSG